MSFSELEILRRSAAMGPLRHEDVNGVIELFITRSRERQQIIDIGKRSPPIWHSDAGGPQQPPPIGGKPIPRGRSGAGGR